MFEKRVRSHFDWTFFGVILLLTAIGLANLYSAAAFWGQEGYANIFLSQCLWMAVGYLLLFAVLIFDYRVIERISYPLFLLTLLLLVVVLILGKEVAGHRSWVSLGPLSLQPSEFAKICFVLALARYYSINTPPPEGYSLAQLFIPFLMTLVPTALTLLQGDLGGSLFFILVFGTVTLFIGIRRRALIIMTVIALLGGGLTYFHGLSDYQKGRIKTFLHPDLDPKGQGYHLAQSKIAVGSGHVWGEGYMKGARNKLLYLPEKHTDFIFPVLAEEWGFVGSSIVLILYASLVFLGLQVAYRAKERFGLLVAVGMTGLLFWQIAVNLGGVLGLLPLTGVTLPLLSYGGSSVISTLVSLGILLNISMRRFMF